MSFTLQLHNFDLFRTCRTSSFCTVAWQLARFQLTQSIARTLGDSRASCYKYVNSHLRNSNASSILMDSGRLFILMTVKRKCSILILIQQIWIMMESYPTYLIESKLSLLQRKYISLYKKLKPKLIWKSGFSPYLVKQLITTLLGPLSLFFSSFLSVGRIPSSWKNAIITPVYKKGLSSDSANYRLVSLSSVSGKVMESVTVADMTD